VAVVLDRECASVPLRGELRRGGLAAEQGGEVGGWLHGELGGGVVDLAGECGVDEFTLVTNDLAVSVGDCPWTEKQRDVQR